MSVDRSRCDVIALSPHPDDADLFCGATLAALSAAGHAVAIVDMSAGELGTNGSVEGRRDESLRAAESLGLTGERDVLGLPDGGIDHRDRTQLSAVVDLLRRRRPTLLLAPYREDRHRDHREASILAKDACFWSGVASFSTPTARTHRPQRLLYYPCHQDAPVNCFVDVTGFVSQWEAAVACYASQFTRGETSRATFLNRPDFVEGLRARRRVWGEHCAVGFAEAFVGEGGLALSPSALMGPSPERGEA